MFFEFGIKDIIDIVLVALMLYYVYRLMKESRSLNVFMGILVFIVFWLVVSQVLEMKLLGSILDKLVSVGVIALIILIEIAISIVFAFSLKTNTVEDALKEKGIMRTLIVVEDKDSVSIECKEENDKVNFSVKVNKKDMGRIIGKQGKTANSIRTLMKSIGSKEGKKVFIEFIG